LQPSCGDIAAQFRRPDNRVMSTHGATPTVRDESERKPSGRWHL
jgi:hypothetical protein